MGRGLPSVGSACALIAATAWLASCAAMPPGDSSPSGVQAPLRTSEIIVTSEAGDKLAPAANVDFRRGVASGTRIVVRPERRKQKILGIGSSFTEASAFVLAHLEADQRREVMQRLYGDQGASFSVARTPIGATDFSVEGKFSYADSAGDAALEHFDIAVDSDGFAADEYPGVVDESYDLLPMIREAMAIRRAHGGDLKIVASAWTAPAWMKDIEDWYRPGTAENGYQGTGGQLKPEYVPTYAAYLVRYLDAYRAAGIPIWGLTPVNEPQGNNGSWESMHFSPVSQSEFIKNHLGPAMREGGHSDVKLLVYDQNRDHLEPWADAILGDPETAPYVYGMAIHWYASTVKVFEDSLDRVKEKFPGFAIVHTEGTIDGLGTDAPHGIGDPEGYKESDWFGNDSFWWNENATDWAYTAAWAPNAEDHPKYTPVHRYARNIIVSLDHWVEGWIDWNVVLDHRGGPNHVGNFCGAPVMIDVNENEVYYTPIYYILAQLSRTIRPGDHAVETAKELGNLDPDSLHASATISPDGMVSVQLLNTTKGALPCALQVGEHFAPLVVPANSLQTVRVRP